MVRTLRYRPDIATHECYGLRGQETSVWCVAASMQMALDFYRYNYTQSRIAQEMGLGTTNNPNGLPYANDGDVVTGLENLTNNALTANMDTTPSWSEVMSEIDENRPVISFVPGHSRAVAGYVDIDISLWGIQLIKFQGLLVYDPWPPNQGAIKWENYLSTTYRRKFTSHVNLLP